MVLGIWIADHFMSEQIPMIWILLNSSLFRSPLYLVHAHYISWPGYGTYLFLFQWNLLFVGPLFSSCLNTVSKIIKLWIEFVKIYLDTEPLAVKKALVLRSYLAQASFPHPRSRCPQWSRHPYPKRRPDLQVYPGRSSGGWNGLGEPIAKKQRLKKCSHM